LKTRIYDFRSPLVTTRRWRLRRVAHGCTVHLVRLKRHRSLPRSGLNKQGSV
jgi:hypothetical protein